LENPLVFQHAYVAQKKNKNKRIASLKTIQWMVESTQKNTVEKVQKGREKNDRWKN
jgi:hypothetical protein